MLAGIHVEPHTHKLLQPATQVPLVAQTRRVALREIFLVRCSPYKADDVTLLGCCLVEHAL